MSTLRLAAHVTPHLRLTCPPPAPRATFARSFAGNGVDVGHLAVQRRPAERVARRGPPQRHPTSGVRVLSELENRVFGCVVWLPLPVAAPLRAAEVAVHEPDARYAHLAHAAEALVQFLGTVVLSDAAAEGHDLKVLPPGRAHAAMGLWRSVIEQVTPSLKTPTVPELRALVKDRLLGPRFLAQVATLTALRHDLAHPMRRLTVQAAIEKLPHLLGTLDQTLLILDFLNRYALLRIDHRDDARGGLWVAPLLGHDDQRKPMRLDWPDAPPTQSVVIASAECHARWLELSPMYRLGRDRTILAYGRADEGRVEHFDVTRPDRVEHAPSDRPDWLRTRLTTQRPRRGRSDLGAMGPALANLSDTAAHDTSGPRPRLPSASLPGVSVPGLTPLPPPKSRSQLPLMVGAALGALAVAAALWAINGRTPGTSEASTALPEPNGAQGALVGTFTDPRDGSKAATAAPASPRRPTDRPLKVGNDRDPSILLQQMSEAYDRADIGAFESAFLDRMNCFYGATPTPGTSHTDKHLLGLSTGRNWRRVHAQREIARRPYGDGSVQEALACITTQDTPKDGKRTGKPSVQYYGLRQTPQGWRIFAIGGPMKGGSDSACTHWLTERFRGAQWHWPEPEDGISLSSWGNTPCGPIPPP